MEQNGNLLLNLKVHVHDVQKADDDVIKDNVYGALSVFGEVDICHFKKEPYDEIYENDAEIILTLAIGSKMNYDDDLHRNILSFDISEKDLEKQLNKRSFDMHYFSVTVPVAICKISLQSCTFSSGISEQP